MFFSFIYNFTIVGHIYTLVPDIKLHGDTAENGCRGNFGKLVYLRIGVERFDDLSELTKGKLANLQSTHAFFVDKMRC